MTRRRAWSGPLTGITFVAGLGGAMARSDHRYPRPGSDDAETRRYFAQRSGAPWISVTGQLMSTASLACFSALAASCPGQSGRASRSLRTATLAGGALAVASLATAALTAAALTARRGGQDDPAALARRAFIAGGPVHGVGFGLLVGALGLAGGRSGELPRPLAVAAVGSGAANLLSPLYFAAEPAGWLIPIGRFSGYLVIGIAGPRLTDNHSVFKPGKARRGSRRRRATARPHIWGWRKFTSLGSCRTAAFRLNVPGSRDDFHVPVRSDLVRPLPEELPARKT